MKLTLLSALFISSALSAAVNDAGPEARHDTAPKINDAGLETRENGQPFCHCIVGQVTNPSNPSYRPNYISDDVPNGSGFIKRYVNLRDPTGKVLEVCWVGFTRASTCGAWKLVDPKAGPACKNLATISCYPGN
ncbi:uncharacterized protein RCO7_03178 [Rhynchosporium graminicola]|uniref:Uncharacterized protein n=1 Tax=Rhynchosporium graminicola TaxID=2792576 RepID=A0A1E1LHP7_9HELO|nr:uncharacterized protein RCO7_03178 [Rhynchosporium commune]